MSSISHLKRRARSFFRIESSDVELEESSRVSTPEPEQDKASAPEPEQDRAPAPETAQIRVRYPKRKRAEIKYYSSDEEDSTDSESECLPVKV